MSIPQLSTMASTCLINHLGYRENEEACEELFKVWEELYDRKDLHPCLESVMNKIENLVIKEFAQEATADVQKGAFQKNIYILFSELAKTCGVNPISTADVQKEALQKNVYRLFSELAKTCGVNPISTDPDVYNSCSLCKAHDEALEIMWSKGIGNRFKHVGLEKASDIRAWMKKAWMKNPKNALLLEGFSGLFLDNLGLKVIPLEVFKYFPNLIVLTVSNNQITAIPAEEVATSKITVLNLSSNQITDIPESLANSNLIKLDLNRNEVTHIPEAFAKALANSKLRELYLNGNKITYIPEVLADWKEDSIMGLSTGGHFPSETTHLFLEENKITHIGGQCLNADDSLIETISEEFNDLDTQIVYGTSEQGSCCTIL